MTFLSITVSREATAPFDNISVIPPCLSEHVVMIWQLVGRVCFKLDNYISPNFHCPGHGSFLCGKAPHRGNDSPCLPVLSSLLLCSRVPEFHTSISFHLLSKKYTFDGCPLNIGAISSSLYPARPHPTLLTAKILCG